MTIDLSEILPKDKIETSKAERLVALGYPAVESVLPEMLEWMKDFNWPVAQVFQPFLVKIGEPLAPYLKNIFYTDDSIWKYWILQCIVKESPGLSKILKPELERLANDPTVEEKNEELNLLAKRILEK